MIPPPRKIVPMLVEEEPTQEAVEAEKRRLKNLVVGYFENENAKH